MKCLLFAITVSTPLVMLVAASCSPSVTVSNAKPVSFAGEIKPLLQENCLPCHHSETLMGGLSMESKARAFGQSERGRYLVPGQPDASLIYTMTEQRHGKQDRVMPADGVLLTDDQRDLLRLWIEQGADWPDGEEGALVPLKVQPGEA